MFYFRDLYKSEKKYRCSLFPATTATDTPTTATGAPTTDTGAPMIATGAPITATGAPTTATGAPTTDTGVPTTATGVPTTATGALLYHISKETRKKRVNIRYSMCRICGFIAHKW